MSQRDSGHKRVPHDLYETPPWVTDAVVPHLPRRVTVYEPAAASGKMVRALRKHGFLVTSSDIRTGSKRDFLDPENRFGSEAIVTNPPYSHAVKFIERALDVTERCEGFVAMLLRVDFDSGSTRQHLFKSETFYKKVVLTRRIEWFERKVIKGKLQGGPSENHAWFIWDWRHKGPATIGYAP
jgi:hypothetical protein